MKDNELSKTHAYIKGKVEESVTTSQILYTELNNNTGAMQLLRDELKKIVADTEDQEEGFQKSKDKIIKLQEMHYNTFLMSKNLEQLQVNIYEFGIMAALEGIKMEFPKKLQEYYDSVKIVAPYTFTIDKGEVVMVKNQTTSLMQEAFKKKSQEEKSLRAVYASLSK